jgi:hypothetical protein
LRLPEAYLTTAVFEFRFQARAIFPESCIKLSKMTQQKGRKLPRPFWFHMRRIRGECERSN